MRYNVVLVKNGNFMTVDYIDSVTVEMPDDFDFGKDAKQGGYPRLKTAAIKALRGVRYCPEEDVRVLVAVRVSGVDSSDSKRVVLEPIKKGSENEPKRVRKLKYKGFELCSAVYNGLKPYEIRLNDRDYQPGDLILPVPVDDDGNEMNHPLKTCVFEITFITQGTEWGLQENYCVFGVRLLGRWPQP